MLRCDHVLVLEPGEPDLLAVVAAAQASRWFVTGSPAVRVRSAALHALADALALMAADTATAAYALAPATAAQVQALGRSALHAAEP